MKRYRKYSEAQPSTIIEEEKKAIVTEDSGKSKKVRWSEETVSIN